MPGRAPSPSRAVASASALALALAIGCGGPSVSQLCRPSNYDACDVRDPVCELRIFRAVQCDRGVSAPGAPRSRVLGPADYRAALEAELPPGPPSPHRDVALRELGLVPAGSTERDALVDLRAERTTVRWLSAQGEIVVLERDPDEPLDRPEHVAQLVEAFVLAIADRRYGLESAYEGAAATTDGRLARDAIARGDALFHRMVFETAQADVVSWLAPWPRILEEEAGALLGDVARTPARAAVATERAPAWLGARALAPSWIEAHYALTVDAFWGLRPEGTLELLVDPFDPAAPGVPPQPLPVRCGAPEPPAGMAAVSEDALGPVYALAFFARSPETAAEAWALAGEVRGDRFVVAGDGGDRTVFQWRIRASSPATAARMRALAAVWAELPGRALALEGDELVLAAAIALGAADAALLASWPDATRCSG